MNIPGHYPTVASLPETPIRLRGARTIRRLGVIGVCGALCIVAVVWAVRVWVFHLPPPENPLGLLVVLTAMLGCWRLLPLIYKFDAEISRDGVRNVNLFGKGMLLRWDDFREQRVKEGRGLKSYKLHDPTADPPRRGRFTASDMGEPIDEWLHCLIRSAWVRLEPPDPPEVLYTRMSFANDLQLVLISDAGLTLVESGADDYGGFAELDRVFAELKENRESLKMIEGELCGAVTYAEARDHTEERDRIVRERQDHLAAYFRFEQSRQGRRVVWSEVESVELWPLEHGRSDFDRLIIHLADREITWRQRDLRSDGKPNYSGTDAADLVTMIRRHVPDERISTSALHGPPLSVEEWERRYEEIVVKRRRDVRSGAKLLIAAPLLMALLSVLGDWPQAVALTLYYGPICFGMWWFKRLDLLELEEQYADWLTELETTSVSSKAFPKLTSTFDHEAGGVSSLAG